MSDQEQDWISKYRAALDSEQGRRSFAGAVIATIRRAWHTLGFGTSSQTTGSPAPPVEAGGLSVKKVAQREVPPTPKDRNTKAS